ncbi:hypothetical protein [Oscillatoria acuminata]|uniref:Uncharacterized protein n=1 Tax=Oscillatoria acuminata PCC 6304 TaxID=56110 RepID=K9TNI1_9CYAN|nr:hypothetical protein [Oscillatoria acuminata]AFY84110.1 hypothetical protein Oscil6304_4597 [Oscillatoria acuminata PCC 6304]
MSLTFDFNSVSQLFEKLKRDASLLDEEVTSDRLFNFVLTGYSMIDWVKNGPSVPESATEDSEVQSLYTDQWLKICGDLATACKHVRLTRRTPITSSATSVSGFGRGRLGQGSFGNGEESITVELNDGTTFDCCELVQGVLETWKTYLLTHGI